MEMVAMRGACVFVVAAALTAGCSGPGAESPTQAENGARPAATPSERATAIPKPDRPRVVCLGDSLTAGYGLSSTAEAYPALLEERLEKAGYDFDVINAGVSGDTSAGGLRRLDWSLQGDVRVLIVGLGANDGLRGLPPSELRANLAKIVEAARARHVRVLLLGMEAPPNFGPVYTREFRAAYREVAEDEDVPLIPFFLEGVAGVGRLNQADGIHPTAEGQRRIADLIWSDLQSIVRANTS
jgi:acyl-CoA thioesterase-1